VISERFEWDDRKALWNEAKHGIAFPKAEQVFDDPLHATMPDALHAEVEDRYVSIGETIWGEVLVVAHAERSGRIRIISARHATPREKRRYMKKEFDTIHDAIHDEDDLQPEYDFTGAVRGKYYRPSKTIIRLTIDEDVARYFDSSELINDALRKLIAEGRAPEPRDE
jgi:uncharacterized DUF497 family protein